MTPNKFVAIAGDPKTGKSHLALTFPDPIIVYSFDIRGTGLIVHKFADKKIEIRQFLPPISATQKPGQDSVDLWEEFKADYSKSIGSGEFNTVVIDPATMLWEIIRNAYTVENERNRLMRRDYGEPNARMLWVLSNPIVVGMNLVTINYLAAVYVDDKDTGEKKLDGFSRTAGLADLVVQTEMKTTGGREKKSIVKARLDKVRFDRDLTGMELDDPDYDIIMALLGIE